MYETKFEEIDIIKKGKVRDIYAVNENLLIVATDRISCFDIVLPTPIPDKGKILTQISLFWFFYLKKIIDNHLISSEIKSLPESMLKYQHDLKNRFMLVKKCSVIPFECVVRGYLSGSGWKEYTQTGRICGVELPGGLTESERLEQPIFTPATKAEYGHDENVDFSVMKEEIGKNLAEKIKHISLSLYKRAQRYAEQRGIIVADTKFEFGILEDRLILIDEVLTPDSSRFWPKDRYSPGRNQESFDKQYVRNYLNSLDWPKNYPAPELPSDIIRNTRKKYLQALRLLTGKELESG